MRKQAFTLAEVLITLAIIGVVAAVSIPSVVANTQQKEFQTGLRKAVSVINSAITMNMALDGESPYDAKDLFLYLQRHMSIMHSTTMLDERFKSYTYYLAGGSDDNQNAAFYTTDGMRFEFAPHIGNWADLPLHESDTIKACNDVTDANGGYRPGETCGGCGSYGLTHNPNNTTKTPCVMLVDVNGDRKPTPANIHCNNWTCGKNNKYIVPAPNDRKLRDIFTILVTDTKAIPYGTTAQKAMYDAQK